MDSLIVESEAFKSWTEAFILFSTSVALLVSANTAAYISESFNLRSETALLVLSLNSPKEVFIDSSSALTLSTSAVIF